MKTKVFFSPLPSGSSKLLVITFALVLLFLAGVNSLVRAERALEGDGGEPSPFFFINGTLEPGQTLSPIYPLFVASRNFNFSLTITGGGPVTMTMTNGSNSLIWNGTAASGEKLWGSGTLTQGNNTFALTNSGGSPANFSLYLYDLPTAPYTWTGQSVGGGLNSRARVQFPTGGLYTFTLNANSGRYQFLLNQDYLQKTVEANTSITYYIPAGVHNLTVVQDGNVGANWSVDISAVGPANDSLPYAKSGGEIGGAGNGFSEEWLPIRLASATQANLAVTLDGTAGDNLVLEVYDSASLQALVLTATVNAGETHWVTFDLPAGTSRLHLAADSGNTDALSYDMTLATLPGPAYTWTGVADPAGENSHIRLTFATAGRYTFNFGLDDGRYQFLLDVGSNSHIQKTVESDDSVTYFVPAGTHDLYVDQDAAGGADWAVGINLQAAGDDSLPYTKSGGELGGSGNDFDEEWLPISLAAAAAANLSIETDGDVGDSLSLEVYQSGSNTPDFTLSQVLGTEKLWADVPLSAGINRLRLVADDGNSAPTSYDLSLTAVPANGAATWDGISLAAGLNSVIAVNFPTTNLYRFQVDAAEGFANLVLDDALVTGGGSEALGTAYDIMVSAGSHEIYTVHDTNFPITDWTASVTPAVAGSSFFTFTGTIAPGDTVTPTYPLFGDALDFNFSLELSGGEPVDLAIRDGSAATIWQGSALDGELLWGTATLTDGNNTATLTNNSASPVTVTLVFYTIPSAAYDWAGIANSAGLNSHIRVNFPSAGLYTFDLTVGGGRYQFLLNDEYIRKTAENNTSVTYFVPAGIHDLFVNQDTTLGADWGVDISAVGPANDSLPYTKSGGELGGSGNDFDEEWLPISLAAPAQVNLAVTLTGTDGDNLLLEAYDTASLRTLILTSTIYAGETHWVTFDLPAGASRLRLVANGGNSDPLSYDLTLSALPMAGYTWSGDSDPAGLNSHIRVIFPASGLYTFDLNVSSGRYQFLLGDSYIQKTVEGDTGATYFVPAGTHSLWLDQDTTAGAGWNIAIGPISASQDSLPYTKSGGDIGGSDNDFTEEWLPIYTGAAVQVNLQITLTGDINDSLSLEVEQFSGPTATLTLEPVFGSESVWATLNLPAEGARLHLTADGGNANPLAYELAVSALPTPPHTWHGRSLDTGVNSNVRLNVAISGTYHVEVFMPEGFMVLNIDNMSAGQNSPQGGGIFYEFDVPLDPGLHTFTSVQDTSFPETTWTVTTTLLTADPLQIFSVAPAIADNQNETLITITGFNFMPGADVELVNGSEAYALTDVTYISANEISAVVPAGLPIAIYDLVVTNPDNQSATLVDGFEVFQATTVIYMPIIHKP